jgi:hypothetical protein
MTIRHTCTVHDDTLEVVAEGHDQGVEEVKAYGEAIIREAIAAGVTRVLCDERRLVYALDTFDTFEVARYMADTIPRVGRVAIVCAQAGIDQGAFWETVAVNRGVQVVVTTEMDRARAWLVHVSGEASGGGSEAGNT